MESRKYNINSADSESLFIELKKYFTDNAWEKEIIHCKSDTMETLVIVIERFFMRNNSTASATYTIIKEGEQVYVVVVAGGAGTGILNISFGAVTDIINDAERTLLALGFKEVD